MGLETKVCLPHDIARAVLFATGEAGVLSLNPQFKMLNARSSKMSAAFSRSVVTNTALQEAQIAEGCQAHLTLSAKVKNTTRWLGLWAMYNVQRRAGSSMRIALTGDMDGFCAEPAAQRVVPIQLSDGAPPVRPTIQGNQGGTAGNINVAHRRISRK